VLAKRLQPKPIFDCQGRRILGEVFVVHTVSDVAVRGDVDGPRPPKAASPVASWGRQHVDV